MRNVLVMFGSIVIVTVAFSVSVVSSGSAAQLDALYPGLPIQDLLAAGHFEPIDDPEAGYYGQDYRVRKDDVDDDTLNRYRFATRNDILLANEPSTRKEYLEHSSLVGHQFVQGGAGEGSQHLKPDGSVQNVQVIKSDSILPAYCNPPNPCPKGYSASQDGCTDDFVNSAHFSKEYQASQECMCDTEHMFNCPGTTNEDELETLARSLTNGNLVEATLDRILDDIQPGQELKEQQSTNKPRLPFGHKVVAKKFFDDSKHHITKRSASQQPKQTLNKQQQLHKSAAAAHRSAIQNPFLTGEKLPVVAKKSPHLARN